MAGAWVSGMVGNYVSSVVTPAISSAGDFAGSALNGVGNGINGVGQSIEGSIRRYGDGAKDYGNAVKDYTNAKGPRVGTAGNPLGLTDTVTGGKHNLTRPRLQQGPAKKADPPKAQTSGPTPLGQKKVPVGPKSTAASGVGPRASAKKLAPPSKPPSDASGRQNTARKDRRAGQSKGDREAKADAALVRLAASKAAK